MGKLIDLTGHKFNMLYVTKRHENNDKRNKPIWECLCDCGNNKIVFASGNDLKSNKVKSCGCLKHNKPKKEKEKKKPIIERHKELKENLQRYNNENDLMKIIEYNGANNVLIEFQDEFKYQKVVNFKNFMRGNVKNPYHKTLYNKGYIGIGDYPIYINKKSTPAYDAWRKMFDRCYSESYHEKEPTYIGCSVCSEWCNFQIFAKWFYDNYYEIENTNMQVDKDWIKHHNKIYCPKYCEIVPSIINSCTVTHDKIKYKELPIGIRYGYKGKYVVYLSKYGIRYKIGEYKDLKKAMTVYKENKIKYIHELANKYKQYISKEIYEQMMDFENRFIIDNPEYKNI